MDRPGAVASGLAFALLVYHVWALLLQAAPEDRGGAVAVLVFQLVTLALLVAATTATGARRRVGGYLLGGLGALLYGLLTWPLLGLVDVVAALAAGWGLIATMLGRLGAGSGGGEADGRSAQGSR